MVKVLKKAKSFFTPKHENAEYMRWLEMSDTETKELLDSLSNEVVSECFNEIVSFEYTGLTSKLGIGPSRINLHTLDHISRSLKQIFSKDKKDKVVIFSNNYANKSTYELFANSLKDNGIEVYSDEDFVQIQGLLSYYLHKQKDRFGIYLDIVGEDVNIKIFNPDGSEFTMNDYFELDQSLKINDFIFAKKLILEKSRIKLIKSEIVTSYFDKLIGSTKKMFSQTAFTIITHSDATEKFANKIKKELEINIDVCRDESKNRNDDFGPKSYRHGYTKARKSTASILFNLNSSGSKLSMAVKTKKTWKFLTSFEFGMVLFSLMGSNTKLETSILLPNFLSKLSNSEGKNRLYLGTDYNHKLNNLSWSDGFINLLFILEKTYKGQVYLDKNLSNLYQDIGYFYDEKTEKHLDYPEFKLFLENLNEYRKMDEINITKLTILGNDDKKILANAKTKKGEIIFFYSKLNNKLITYYYTLEKDYSDSYTFKTEVKKTTENFVLNREDDGSINSNKSLTKTFLFVGIFITGMLLVFSFQFSFESITYSTNLIFDSFDLFETYVLLGYFIILPTIYTLVYYVITKQFKDDARFIDIFKGMVIYLFFSQIIPILVIAAGSLYWYLKSKGYKMSEMLPATSAMILFFSITNFAFSLSMILYSNSYLTSIGIQDEVLFYTAIGGLAWFTFNFAYLFVFAYSSRFQTWIFMLIERFSFFLKREKHYVSIYNSLNFNIQNTKKNAKIVLKKYNTALLCCLIIVLGRIYFMATFYCSINLVMFNTLGIRFGNFWGISSVNIMLSSAASLVPVPGGMGIYEYFMGIFLVNSIEQYLLLNSAQPVDPVAINQLANEMSMQISFIYRFFTYYGLTFAMMIPFLIKIIKARFFDKRKNVGIWKH